MTQAGDRLREPTTAMREVVDVALAAAIGRSSRRQLDSLGPNRRFVRELEPSLRQTLTSAKDRGRLSSPPGYDAGREAVAVTIRLPDGLTIRRIKGMPGRSGWEGGRAGGRRRRRLLCTIREKPDQRCCTWRRRRPQGPRTGTRQCRWCQRRGSASDLRAVPVRRPAFGPGRFLPRRVARGRRPVGPERCGTAERLLLQLPLHRERSFRAVQISMGCSSTCAYCIVPSVRRSEPWRDPCRDRAARSDGVAVTRSQNVNGRGRDLRRRRIGFAEILRAGTRSRGSTGSASRARPKGISALT